MKRSLPFSDGVRHGGHGHEQAIDPLHHPGQAMTGMVKPRGRARPGR